MQPRHETAAKAQKIQKKKTDENGRDRNKNGRKRRKTDEKAGSEGDLSEVANGLVELVGTKHDVREPGCQTQV
eukprot:1366471-Rhodomonas_salina.5